MYFTPERRFFYSHNGRLHMKHFITRITSNREVANGYFEMAFEWPDTLETPVAGAFLTTRVSHSAVPLLRRPFAFSFHDVAGSTAGILYERRGIATSQLCSRVAGDSIDVLAPLGVPFPAPSSGKRPVLVAGGIGMGPIFFLASTLAGNADSAAPVLCVGARHRDVIPSREVYDSVRTIFATDDGTLGFHGNVVEALRHSPDLLDESLEFFACGPTPMLQSIHEFASAREEKCWVSVEQTMGCAVGACMGCTVRVHGGNGYARVCTEGPVFASEEMVWT